MMSEYRQREDKVKVRRGWDEVNMGRVSATNKGKYSEKCRKKRSCTESAEMEKEGEAKKRAREKEGECQAKGSDAKDAGETIVQGA